MADLATRPEKLHIICTGRSASPRLIEAADLVTEMKAVKHPFDKGVFAQKGIEF
jgi:cob(I)alamin adenosyltransferase